MNFELPNTGNFQESYFNEMKDLINKIKTNKYINTLDENQEDELKENLHRLGSMFYLLLFSKLIINILGGIFDKFDLIINKSINFIKSKFLKIKLKKKIINKQEAKSFVLPIFLIIVKHFPFI